MMITREFAVSFAAEWIAAWNARDLPRVLAHYTEDFEMSSPFIIKFAGERSGTLQGKDKVRAYWQAALDKNSGLHFELLDMFVGAGSLTLHYRRETGKQVTEVLFFNEEGLVYRAAAQYHEH